MAELHDALEHLAAQPLDHLPARIPARLANIARLCSTLDPNQCYPLKFSRANYKTPLEHMVSLLQDYFHGADIDDDATIRDGLFTIVGDVLKRHGNIDRHFAWVIPRLLDPMLSRRGWNPSMSPSGIPYAISVGRILAPVMPGTLCADIMSEGSDALVCLTKQSRDCDMAWHAMESVAPVYLDRIVEGAYPIISARMMAKDVAHPQNQPTNPGPRL